MKRIKQMKPLRSAAAAGLGLALVAGTGGCSVLADSGTRQMTVYFPKARSFYQASKVKIMGADVGRVDSVENQGDRIKVRFHIDGDIPLPKGVQASIVPLNLIGERNLVLGPAWHPGQPKETGDVIPIERTKVPVETDDALDSFTKLADALNPTKVRNSLGRAADSFEGNGQEFNAALEQGARLTTSVAGQDKELLAVAQNLNRLAGVVRGREQVLGQMINGFGQATRVISAERQDLQQLVRELVVLSEQGNGLITKYQGQLPYDIAMLTKMGLVLNSNSKEVSIFIKSIPALADLLFNGYDPETKAIKLRFATNAFLRGFLKGFMNSDDVDCPLGEPNSNCPWEKKK